MTKLEAMLIDIDGTLVDSNEKHTDCWLEAFAHFGVAVPRDEIRRQIGKGGDLLVPDTLRARETRRFGEALKKYRGELWKRRYMESVEPFPGVREALEQLHGRGIRLALASSANADEVEYYVELLGVEKLLEGSTSKKDAETSKPAPDIFQAALAQVDADPAAALVVGDTPWDVIAAHRIPIATAALLCGGFARETLTKAEFLFDDLSAMTKEIERIDEYFREHDS